MVSQLKSNNVLQTYKGTPVVFFPFIVHISSITRIQLGNIKLLRVEDFVKLIVKSVIVLQQNKAYLVTENLY